MKRKNKILISSILVIGVLFLLIGFTYAYYLSNIKGNTTTRSLQDGMAYLELTFTDNSSEINFTNAEPGSTTKTKTFTVSNTGDKDLSSYAIRVKVNSNYNTNSESYFVPFDANSGLKYDLVCSSNDSSYGCNGVTNGVYPTSDSIVVTNSIRKGYTHTYTLTVRYEDTGNDQRRYMGVVFESQIFADDIKNVSPFTDSTTLAYVIHNNAVLGNNGTTIGTGNISRIGYEISPSTESVLLPVNDELGTSYLFRGNVQNNYVNFANMCWRIVRINGNQTIKLILEDKASTCENAEGNWPIINANSSSSYPFYGSWGFTRTEELKYYGNYTSPGMDYGSNRTDKLNTTWRDESMYYAFNKFLNNQLNSYTYKLADYNWCINDLYYTSYSGDYLNNSTPLTNAEYLDVIKNGDNSLLFSYDADYRLRNYYVNPVLKCYSNNKVNSKIGTLTADEVVYAGARAYNNEANTSYYLMNDYVLNYDGDYPIKFYTFSKATYVKNNDFIFTVEDNGFLGRENAQNASSGTPKISLRPAVNLVKNTKYSSGDGTKENPYVIK